MGASASIPTGTEIDYETLVHLCGEDFSEEIFNTYKNSETNKFPTTKLLELKEAKEDAKSQEESKEEHDKVFNAYLGCTVDIKDMFKQITIKCCSEMPENVVGTIIEYLNDVYPEHARDSYGTGFTYTPDMSTAWKSPNESSGIKLLEAKKSLQEIVKEYLSQKDVDNMLKNIVVSVLTGKPHDPVPAIIEYLLAKYPEQVQRNS